MSWRARLGDERFQPQGRPPSRPASRTSLRPGAGAGQGAGTGPPATQPRVPRPLAPQGQRRDGRGGPTPSGGGGAPRRPAPRTAPSGARPGPSGGRTARATVVRPLSAPSVRSSTGQYPSTPTARPRAAQASDR
ncbi:Serine/threonine-protein kinase TAO1, partial [Frankliniella fusca]